MILLISTSELTASSLKSSYISVKGTDTSQLCTVINSTLSASYFGSYDGYWSTSSDYLSNKSVYILSFQGASIEYEQFSSTMSLFKDKLMKLGERGSNRTNLWNTFAWGTFEFTENNLRFFSSADAGITIC